MMLEGLIRQAIGGRVVLTKFLDEGELSDLLNRKDLKVYAFGGFKDAERKRAIIANESQNFSPDDYEIIAYQIFYPESFLTISHRNILGTLLSLGIKRETLGDIIVTDDKAYFLCIQEVAPYLEQNFLSINHKTIRLQKVSLESLEGLNAKLAKEDVIIVASLRLDAIVAKLMNASRDASYEHIVTNHVLVNHKEVDNHHYLCKVGDVLSIRKWGRAEITDISPTKKLRQRVEVKIWR